MRMMQPKFWFLFLAVAACSKTQDSKLSDVTLTGANGANELVWIDNNEVYHGDCEQGMLPMRQNCGINVFHVALDVARAGVNTSLDKDAAQLEKQKQDEILRLKMSDPTIAALSIRIQELTNQAYNLNYAIANLNTQLTSTNSERLQNDRVTSDYNTQIAGIDARLANDPTNAELIALKEQLTKERDQLLARKAQLDALADELTTQIASNTATLDTVNAELAQKQAAYQTRFDNLNVSSAELTRIATELGHIETERTRITPMEEYLAQSDITHRANLLSYDDQQVIQRFRTAVMKGYLQIGYYTRSYYSDFDCNHRILDSNRSGSGWTLTVQWVDCWYGDEGTTTFSCNENGECSGYNPTYDSRTIRVLSPTQYEYSGYWTSDIRTWSHDAQQVPAPSVNRGN